MLQSLFDGDQLRLQKFPQIQFAIFVAGARVSEACVSLVGGMTRLTAALMKCDKLFCIDFLASSELIGHLDLTDSYEMWPKCSLIINVQKCVRLF